MSLHETFEKRDANFAYVGWGVALVVASLALALAVARYIVQNRMPGFGFRSTNQPLAMLTQNLPPEPRLGPAPWLALQTWQRDSQDRLHGYGWSDRSRGLAFMPLERAFQELTKPETPKPSAAKPRGR